MASKDYLQIDGDPLHVFISHEEIASRVADLAAKIKSDYGKENVRFLCVLKGAFVFAADLIRNYDGPCSISFIRLSSYQGTESTGKVKKVSQLPADLEGQNVIIVEDIVDTGITMQYLIGEVQKLSPKSIKVASLFNKPSRRKCEVNVDYVGFEIEDKFIVGYGLDYDELFRNLPDVYIKQ